MTTQGRMATHVDVPDHTPVLVGIGTASRREEDFKLALEPMDLMLEAVHAAGRDCASAAALAGLQWIAVPRGRWRYRDPARAIAQDVGAAGAVSVLSSVGVLQQTLVGEACNLIATGEAHTTLVAGADAGYRLLRAQIAGQEAPERTQHTDPDVILNPAEELRHAVEKRVGLRMPVGLYALMESAFRARKGWTVDEHRDRLATLGERFSRIASQNPHAWHRQPVAAATIREAGERNPMQAFPYTRWHCSTWNVDQAAALLFCSAARAQALGIPRERWVFPVASTESNHMVPVSVRDDLAGCPGARIAGRAALDAGELQPQEVDLVELYSCFPIAVQAYADALDLPLDRELTVTGGMPFAGGPYNNYQLQAICRAAELLREGRGRNALVSGVSGVLTKQGFGLWSMDPPPRGFVNEDVTVQVARESRTLDVVDNYSGPARVAGCTVLYGRGQAPRGIALVDTPEGARAMVTTTDAGLIDRMQSQECVGVSVSVEQDQWMP